jgi:uncharacterized membrane protein YhaH (DUF805 family)
MNFGYLFASTAGRIPRRDFWMGFLVLFAASLIVGFLIMWVFGWVLSTGAQVVLFLFQVIFAYPSYALLGKRFQDRDKPGNFALIGIGLGLLKALLDAIGVTGDLFAPTVLDWSFNIAFLIVGIWFLIELGFLRGTVGPNTFGPDPLEAGRTG